MSIKFYNRLDIDSDNNQITSETSSTTVTSLLLNNSGTGDASILIDAGDKYILGVDNSEGLFRIAPGSTLGTTPSFSLKTNGLVMFDQYGGGNFTGTEKYNLQVDSSGNIIETDAINNDVISGTGTANQVPKFQSDHVLVDSGLEIDASQNALFPANLNVGYTLNNTQNAQVAFKKSEDINVDTNAKNVFIDYNLSGTTAQTNDRYYDALTIDLDSSATGGNTTNETRLSGLRCLVTDTGDSNDIYGGNFDVRATKTVANDKIAVVYGVYGTARAGHTAGEVANVYGGYFQALSDNASSGTDMTSLSGVRGIVSNTSDSGKTVQNVYGGYFKVDQVASSNNSVFTNADGVYGEIEIDDGDVTIGSARAVKGIIDSNAGTITSAYQFYGTTSAAGTITNNWGIYSQNATKNYLDGTLQLASYGAGTLVTDASGNITVSSGGGAGGPYLPLAGGTLTGDLTISKNVPRLLFDNTAGGGLDPILAASGNNFTISTTSITPVTIGLQTGDVLFASDIEASGIYVGATNTSFDFYNNGTSYFNGAVTVDATFTQSGGGDSNFSGDIYMPATLYHTGDTDTYYSFSTDSILESAGGDKGYTHSKNEIIIGPTGASTSTMYFDLANRKVGFRTETPGSAFDVNGTIRVRNQLNVGNTTEQNLFVDGNGGAGGKYVKMGNYGQGNYFGISTNINQPKYIAAYGSAGKMVEERRIITIKLSGNAFSNLSSTGTTLIAAPGANSIILPYEILIYKSSGTTGTGWPSSSPNFGAEIGFCQGSSINCSLTNAFDAVWKLPRALVTQTGTWFWSRSNATLNEVGANTYQLNKALVLRSASNLTALPTASWYVQIRYVQMNYTAGLVNNVDIDKTSNG